MCAALGVMYPRRHSASRNMPPSPAAATRALSPSPAPQQMVRYAQYLWGRAPVASAAWGHVLLTSLSLSLSLCVRASLLQCLALPTATSGPRPRQPRRFQHIVRCVYCACVCFVRVRACARASDAFRGHFVMRARVRARPLFGSALSASVSGEGACAHVTRTHTYSRACAHAPTRTCSLSLSRTQHTRTCSPARTHPLMQVCAIA